VVITSLQTELKGPGSLLGYRAMWYRLKYKYNLRVKRSDDVQTSFATVVL